MRASRLLWGAVFAAVAHAAEPAPPFTPNEFYVAQEIARRAAESIDALTQGGMPLERARNEQGDAFTWDTLRDRLGRWEQLRSGWYAKAPAEVREGCGLWPSAPDGFKQCFEATAAPASCIDGLKRDVAALEATNATGKCVADQWAKWSAAEQAKRAEAEAAREREEAQQRAELRKKLDEKKQELERAKSDPRRAALEQEHAELERKQADLRRRQQLERALTAKREELTERQRKAEEARAAQEAERVRSEEQAKLNEKIRREYEARQAEEAKQREADAAQKQKAEPPPDGGTLPDAGIQPPGTPPKP